MGKRIRLATAVLFSAILIGQVPAEATGAVTTTTIPQDPARLSAMEWVQSVTNEPAYAGFKVEERDGESIIVLAKVRGREFSGPVPSQASSVEFVEADLGAAEFHRGMRPLTDLLAHHDQTIVALDYDPFAGELRLWRHQDDVDAAQIDATIVRQALIAVYGDRAARIGYGYQESSAVSPSGLPRPGVREELTQQKLGQVVERIQDNLFDIQLTIDALEYDETEDRVVIRVAGTDLLWANLSYGIHEDGLQVPRNNYSLERPTGIWPESNPLQAPRGDPDPLIRTLLVVVLALGGGVVFLLDRRKKDAALLRAARNARF